MRAGGDREHTRSRSRAIIEQPDVAHSRCGDAALVSVLAYEGLRPGEAFALPWGDVLERGRPRDRLRIVRGLSERAVTTPKSARARSPELFGPVASELAELYLTLGRPGLDTLVFGDAKGGHLRRQNWRQRVWIPALAAAGERYFRPYDLRHTCATLLIYEGRPVTEVAAHMGHADPGFTARVYGHVFQDSASRRRVPLETAIAAARSTLGTAYAN